jgi:Kef-type K+ transport system membrane component KefB
MAETAASLPYQEPGIRGILTLSSFLLVLNVVNFILDRLLYCGLLGQVLVSIAWGLPGARWLSPNVEEVVVQLGYLGLILLVYEGISRLQCLLSDPKACIGGLSTSISSLKANFILSIAVALTGIAVPIALSFSLRTLVGATPLQAFAAGAALCSTSLGTTFTILSTSGLVKTRLGIVLTSAAMMDDVVGLVMVQVISNFGIKSHSSLGPITIIRPVLVSLAFAIVVPLMCKFIVKPIRLLLSNRGQHGYIPTSLRRVLCLKHTAFLLHTGILIGLVTGASYAGTSVLFAAYTAGAGISWWDTLACSTDDELNETQHHQGVVDRGSLQESQQPPSAETATEVTAKPSARSTPNSQENQVEQSTPHKGLVHPSVPTGALIYEQYYSQPVATILKPFFFASIGFSIPITRMFTGAIVWRGIVYTILMVLGKLICGIWLVRLSLPSLSHELRNVSRQLKLPSSSHVSHLWGRVSKRNSSTSTSAPPRQQGETMTSAVSLSPPQVTASQFPEKLPNPSKPLSLHPALVVAFAMTARGEIGFLISAVAESKGVFSSPLPSDQSSSGESDIFLIVTWAIVLCTFIGPLSVGLLVRRLKLLEAQKGGGN